MKPTVKIASTRTQDGGLMELYQHDREFIIRVNGQDLMLSRQHESELELARLGCSDLVNRRDQRVLIGGLGMGYTLRQTLDMMNPKGVVVMGELMSAVVDWNREFLGELNDHPLRDERVDLRVGDIVPLIAAAKNEFDAILLDVDNGPNAMTDLGNSRLYGPEGIKACRRALRRKGCLAIWSAEASKEFEHVLMTCDLHVRRYRVPAYKGAKSQGRFVWVASELESMLPEGGGEPRPAPMQKPQRRQRWGRGRR